MVDRSETLVTVFGGGGFIGRYVCEFLLRSGVRVRVAQRNPRAAYTIQPLAQVGQVGYERADITRPASVAHALRGANSAINLCGVFGPGMRRVHVEGAANVAKAAAAAGCQSLLQISAMGADPNGEALYARTKGDGEAAVRQAFPSATIIRPSLVFGPEDNLTNRFAGMAKLPVLPVLAADSKFQPVYVRDLGQAISMAALDPQRFGGQTYEIGGPQVLTMLELHRAILALTGQNPEIAVLPNIAGSLLSKLGWLPGAPLTADQWTMLQQGSVPSGDLPGLDAFGIEPTPLGAVGYEWLGRYHKGGKFAGRRIHLTATN
jgi:NADH dehydrogenase